MEGITRAEDWTDGEPDPKTDLKKAIMLEHPMHREGLIKGLDPEGKIWTAEERKEMMEAPYPTTGMFE